jgi:hypothetical protein
MSNHRDRPLGRDALVTDLLTILVGHGHLDTLSAIREYTSAGANLGAAAIDAAAARIRRQTGRRIGTGRPLLVLLTRNWVKGGAADPLTGRTIAATTRDASGFAFDRVARELDKVDWGRTKAPGSTATEAARAIATRVGTRMTIGVGTSHGEEKSNENGGELEHGCCWFAAGRRSLEERKVRTLSSKDNRPPLLLAPCNAGDCCMDEVRGHGVSWFYLP